MTTSATRSPLVGGPGARHEDGGGAAEAGVLERGAHERGGARGGHAADHVGGADRHAAQPLLAVADVVLGALDGAGEGRRAAGDDRDQPRGGDAERRHALDGVEGAEAPGGAGADVDQPPARRPAGRRPGARPGR